VNPPLPQIAAALLLATALPAQTPSTTKPAPKTSAAYINHNLIFLDPAHGGPDEGARLSNGVLEKDVTLALANRIRTLLAGNNLSVLLAREADAPPHPAPDPPIFADPSDPSSPSHPPTPTPAQTPTPDTRAGVANHVHPVACILLHATSSGNGVHIVTSALATPDTSLPLPYIPSRIIPWNSAQTDSLPQSLRLANEIGVAIARANLPVHLSRASVKPIDSLLCPAVAVEIAPIAAAPPSAAVPVSDPAYQQRVAEAVATALLFWRGHADPTPSPQPDLGPASSTPGVEP